MVNPFKKKYAVVSIHPRYGELTTSRTFITRYCADKWADSMNRYASRYYQIYRYYNVQYSKWVVKEL